MLFHLADKQKKYNRSGPLASVPTLNKQTSTDPDRGARGSDRIFALKFFSGIYDRGILWVSSGIIRENEIIGRRISEYSDQSISSLFSAKIVSLKVLCGYARDHRAGRCAHRRTPSLAPEHPHDAGACVCTLIAMFSGLSSMANRTPQTASLCTRDLGFLRL